jgi:hypothetical protein
VKSVWNFLVEDLGDKAGCRLRGGHGTENPNFVPDMTEIKFTLYP